MLVGYVSNDLSPTQRISSKIYSPNRELVKLRLGFTVKGGIP